MKYLRRRENYKRLEDLILDGTSYAEIGRQLGITRQSVHAMAKRLRALEPGFPAPRDILRSAEPKLPTKPAVVPGRKMLQRRLNTARAYAKRMGIECTITMTLSP